MTSKQNAIEIAKDRMDRGLLTAAEANVLMVQMEGVRLVTGKMPIEVRRALNDAVRKGELGHIKKEGLKPEAYHNKNARGRALDERERVFKTSIENLTKCFTH